MNKFLATVLILFTLNSFASDNIGDQKLRANLDNKIIELKTLVNGDLAVIVAYGIECPILGKHTPTLKKLIKNYLPKGINFIFINSIKRSSEKEIDEALKNFDLDVHVYHNTDAAILKTLGFTTLSEVALVKLSTNEVLYIGAINNQVTLDLTRKAATANYLQDAIESALKKEAVKIKSTKPFGCEITF